MSKKKASDVELIVFKLHIDLFKQLEAYAKTQVDEAGKTLSPALAARRLMLEGLKRQKKP